ncbi:MAG: acyltransferase [Methylococcaceae bacterium]|nr:acyltransferase [Methylococcaceae bacterium]
MAQSWLGSLIYRSYSLLREITIRFLSWAKAATIFPDARNLVLDVRADIKYPQNIRMGAHVIIGADCQIGAMASVEISDHVRMSRGVTIETASLEISGTLPYSHKAKPIIIGKGVWLGAHVIVLGGVTIGEGAVIGAGAIVTRDVSPHSIVVGASTRQWAKITSDASR